MKSHAYILVIIIILTGCNNIVEEQKNIEAYTLDVSTYKQTKQ